MKSSRTLTTLKMHDQLQCLAVNLEVKINYKILLDYYNGVSCAGPSVLLLGGVLKAEN